MEKDKPSISSELSLELHVTNELCRAIGSVRALTVALMVKYEAWHEYLDLTVNAMDYEDPLHFAGDYLVSNVLRKSPNLPLDVDRDLVALESFLDSEDQCRETNNRLRNEPNSPLLQGVSRQISRILPVLDKPTLQKIVEAARHGPGATTGVRGKGSISSDKYDGEVHLTASLIAFARSIMGEPWWDYNSTYRKVVKGNRFSTVPKNAKTNRGICVEPTLNMFIQKGIGRVLRAALKRSGINLNKQDRNRELSRDAYSKNYCTIDLSQASDSMSYETILQLFPEDWTHLLSLVRSDTCEVSKNQEPLELEKFSSMGNGFTFELESLLFLAVLRHCIPRREHRHIGVYGDDLICPTKYSAVVIDTLNYLGFKVNISKSFLAGNFFESCGAHWFRGVDVTPFYLQGAKEAGEIPYSMQIANKLRKYAATIGGPFGCDDRFRSLWLDLYHMTPKPYRRCRVPELLGDVGFICSYKEAQRWIKPYRRDFGHQGYLCRTIRAAAKQCRHTRYSTALVAYAGGRPEVAEIGNPPFSKGRQPIRGYLGQPSPKFVHVLSWTTGLEWIRTGIYPREPGLPLKRPLL